MRKSAFILVAGVVLTIAFAWAMVIWVPSDAAVFVWSAELGSLRVPTKGLMIAPRWSGERLDATALVAEVRATTGDSAKIGVTVTLRPPVGVWRLQPAKTPKEGLRRSIAGPVRERIGELPLRCVAQPPAPTAECPSDPALDLRRVVAMALALPEEAIEVTLAPEPESVRAGLLTAIAEDLVIPQRKVLLLGLDGLDWDLVLPWVRSGRMPNLQRVMDAGTWGDMESIVPMLSPIIWTTVATGVTPDVHRVLDFVEKDPSSGQMVPITGRSRRVPAIWNLASALGLDVGVVGWWATWPAERVNGTMVTDRLYYTLQQGIPEDVFRRDPPDLVYPPERTKEFTALRDRAVTRSDWRAVAYFMNVQEAVFDRAVSEDRGMEDPVDGMRRILSATRTYMGAGLVLAGERPDLLMVYLEGTDTIGHLLAQYLPPPTLEIDAATAAVYAAAVPKYFEIVDRWIGRYLEACPLDEHAVVIVSDHGFKWGKERPRGLSGTAGKSAPLWHAKDAVFAIAGPGVARHGRVEGEASVYDIAPTVAALLGIPADPAWRTALLPGCPPAATTPVEWAPILPPASYRRGAGAAAPVDPEFIAKLQALGYLGQDGVSVAAAAPASTASAGMSTRAAATPTPQSASTTRSELNNLGVVRINQKEYDEAERLLRQAIAMSPSYPSPHYNLRRMYMETQQYERADEELWIAVDKGLRDPERTIDRAAADYESLSLPERADVLLTRAIARFPDHEPFYVHLMVVRVRDGRFTEALPVGAIAVEKFPESGPVHAFYGLAAASAGRAGLARRELERSLAVNPKQPMLRQALEQIEEADTD
ncbi:MAG: alkaline phosphatase family protein [Thermoanaerobaculales bacterium]